MALNIGLIGEYSSGKSSLLNAMAGGFVSTNSLLRETIQTEAYEFSKGSLKGIAKNLDKRHSYNRNKRKNLKDLDEEKISKPIWYTGLPNNLLTESFMVYDFPGMNDANDDSGLFLKTIENNIDQIHLLIFVTDANRAFASSSEVEAFRHVQELVENQNKNGKFTDLIILVNKYDDEDEDLEEIYNDMREITKDVRTFRFSSHKFFINQVMNIGNYIPIPECQKKELRNIMKNTGVLLNKHISEFIKKGRLPGKLVKVFDDSSSGDMDHVMNYIQCVQNNLIPYKRESISQYFENKLSLDNNGMNDIKLFMLISKLYEDNMEYSDILDQYLMDNISSISNIVLIKLYQEYDQFKKIIGDYLILKEYSETLIEFYYEWFAIHTYPIEVFQNRFMWEAKNVKSISETKTYNLETLKELISNSESKNFRSVLTLALLPEHMRLHYYRTNQIPYEALNQYGLTKRFMEIVMDNGLLKWKLFESCEYIDFDMIDINNIKINSNQRNNYYIDDGLDDLDI